MSAYDTSDFESDHETARPAPGPSRRRSGSPSPVLTKLAEHGSKRRPSRKAPPRPASGPSLRIAELTSELAKSKRELEELRTEARLLTKIQRRQARALERFEAPDSDVGGALKRKDEEIRVLREQLRGQKDKGKSQHDKHKESQRLLAEATKKVEELTRLVEEKDLKTRSALATQVEQMSSKLRDKDAAIARLERKVELEEKERRRERKRPMEESHTVTALQREVERLTAELDKKEKKLQKQYLALSVVNITTASRPTHPPTLEETPTKISTVVAQRQRQKEQSEERRSRRQDEEARIKQRHTERANLSLCEQVEKTTKSQPLDNDTSKLQDEQEERQQAVQLETQAKEDQRRKDETEKQHKAEQDALAMRNQQEQKAAEAERQRTLAEEEARQRRFAAEQEAAAARMRAEKEAAEQRCREEELMRQRTAEAERLLRQKASEDRECVRRAEEERQKKDALLAKMRAIDATQHPSTPVTQQQEWAPAAPPPLQVLDPVSPQAAASSNKSNALPWLNDGPKKSKRPTPTGTPFANMHKGLTSDGRRLGSGHSNVSLLSNPATELLADAPSPSARRAVSGRRAVEEQAPASETTPSNIKRLPIPPIVAFDPSRPPPLEARADDMVASPVVTPALPHPHTSAIVPPVEKAVSLATEQEGTQFGSPAKVLSPRSSTNQLPWGTKVNSPRIGQSEPRLEPAVELPMFKRASNVRRTGRGHNGPGANSLAGLQTKRPKRQKPLMGGAAGTIDPEDDGLEAIAI